MLCILEGNNVFMGLGENFEAVFFMFVNEKFKGVIIGVFWVGVSSS